jgi:hypothetical protein
MLLRGLYARIKTRYFTHGKDSNVMPLHERNVLRSAPTTGGSTIFYVSAKSIGGILPDHTKTAGLPLR